MKRERERERERERNREKEREREREREIERDRERRKCEGKYRHNGDEFVSDHIQPHHRHQESHKENALTQRDP